MKFEHGRKCWECGKRGHFARDHKKEKISGNANARDSADYEDIGNAHHATMLMAIDGNAEEEVAQFLMDSGASDNMVNNLDWMTDVQRISEKKIVIGNGDTLSATHRGTLQLDVRLLGGGPAVTRTVTLKEVLYVPRLKANLISCSSLCREGYHLTFHRNVCVVWDSEYIEMQGIRSGGVYVVHGKPHKDNSHLAMAASSSMTGLWHDRLGQANIPSIRKLERQGAVLGLKLDGNKKDPHNCTGCATGKFHRLVMKRNLYRSEKIGEVIHSDVSGKMSVESLGGARYYVTFFDECSRYVTVFPIAKKSDVLDKLKLFRPWFERKYDCKIKTLQCDGMGEYVACDAYLEEHGIERPQNPSYCPGVNGIAERANRSLMESARAMMHHGKLPKQFWAEAVVTAADVRNRFFCPGNESTTSYEMLTGRKPRVDHIRVFGSKAWVHVPKEKRKKLDIRAKEGIIVGCYDNSQYKVWMKQSGSMQLARHLRVLENDFPGKHWFNFDGMETEELDESRSDVEIGSDAEQQEHGETAEMSAVSSRSLSRAAGNETEGTREMLTYVPAQPSRFGMDDDDSAVSDRPSTDLQETHVPVEGSRYPSRSRSQPNFYSPGNAFLSTVDDEPATVKDAMEMRDAGMWKKAIQEEMESLKQHETWEIASLPRDARVLQSRFIFKLKRKADGTVARYKARLVVRGFMQGFVEKTYSLVVDFSTVRIALAVAM